MKLKKRKPYFYQVYDKKYGQWFVRISDNGEYVTEGAHIHFETDKQGAFVGYDEEEQRFVARNFKKKLACFPGTLEYELYGKIRTNLREVKKSRWWRNW